MRLDKGSEDPSSAPAAAPIVEHSIRDDTSAGPFPTPMERRVNQRILLQIEIGRRERRVPMERAPPLKREGNFALFCYSGRTRKEGLALDLEREEIGRAHV